MDIVFPSGMKEEFRQAVHDALATRGILNVPLVAEQIRLRNEHRNIALEDIAAQLVATAQMFNAAMEFDSGGLNS